MNHNVLAMICASLAISSGLTDCDACRSHEVPTTCVTHPDGVGGLTCSPTQYDVEPNDTLPTAHSVGIGCDGESTLNGKLGSNDTDVYYASGTLCDKSKPTASWQRTRGQLCLFAGCEHGLMTFRGCPAGAQQKHFVEGILGCCIEGPGTVTLDIDCSLNESHVRNWIVVLGDARDSCDDYSVSYHD